MVMIDREQNAMGQQKVAAAREPTLQPSIVVKKYLQSAMVRFLRYVNLQLDDNIDDIICYKKDPAQPNWKIASPESMVVDTIKWFHQVMGHPGERRLRETLNQCYHHPKLCYHIDRLKYTNCQKYKLAGHGYGLLPKQEMRIAPWEEVAIDLIGPWKVMVNGRVQCIDLH
jgi:hypothetical protein